ncbi:uncharacterized protein LOC134413208 [Elgaria multicarinata webbii]|uniref:uncharacterized protein LOC134413208 n=1 Tax=Elgaria multicarinata webbii TaxID=159646 RepID=UPI002FCD04B8
MNPPRLCLDGIPESDVKERRGDTLPKTPTVNPSQSAPGNVTPLKKRAIKKILVDLRPILEKVTDPLASGQEEMLEDPQKTGCSSPTIGGSRGDDLIRAEAHTTKMATVEGGEGHTVEMTTVHSQEEDISWPPTVDPFRAFDLDAKPHEGTQSQLGESTQLQGNNSPAVLTLQPQFKTPVFFPKITPQQRAPLETDNSTEPPAPPSPDFQLPTQLLLQRLQETTTSTHHVLITQVLSSLREELLVPSPCDGEKRDTSPEAPQTKTRRSRATDVRRKEPNVGLEATKRRLRKFTWIRDRPLYSTGREEPHPTPISELPD